MVDWCREQGLLLGDLARALDSDLVHPRAAAALLGIANSALKTSQFKLEGKAEIEVILFSGNG